jgi:hypothetical protein
MNSADAGTLVGAYKLSRGETIAFTKPSTAMLVFAEEHKV